MSRTKSACIIAATKLNGSLCLLKNRDRRYRPDLVFLHAEIAKTEVCVIYDKITKYCEGMNEYGIGVINSSLLVIRDENEGDQGSGSPKTTEDGQIILKALSHKNLEEVVKSLKTYKGGLKGHTLVADKDQIYFIEASKTNKPHSELLDPDKVNARTNHGVYYPDAGYQTGDNYVSSIVRRWEAQKRIQNIKTKEDLGKCLVPPIHDKKSPFNLVKNTDKMHTTSQAIMDLKKKEVWLYLFPSQVDFSGTVNKLGRKPKIKTRLFKYR